jgi:hypothetical protein
MFLQSGGFKEIDLTSPVEPWGKLIDIRQGILRKHTTNNKQKLLMLK